MVIPNTAPAHVYLGTGQPAAVAAWDDDGHPMIVSPTGLCRADAVPFGMVAVAGPGQAKSRRLVAMSHMPRASAISAISLFV